MHWKRNAPMFHAGANGPTGRRIGVAWVVVLATALIPASGCTGAPPQPQHQAGGSVASAHTPGSLTEQTALALAALPLACLDRPQPAPHGTGYLYQRGNLLRPDFHKARAFYGCYDWHSAVNSTWALAAILDRFPDLPIAGLIAEKLDEHLSTTAIQGEMEFFDDPGNRSFERPYGFSWLLFLYAELDGSTHPAAAGWAAALRPLAEMLASRLPDYLEHLDYPMRVGTHHNTAFALSLSLRYARTVGDEELLASVDRTARRLFAADTRCPLAYEPSGADFLSPCLEEAELIAKLLPPEQFAPWLEAFLPPANDPALAALGQPLLLAEDNAQLDIRQLGAKSHLVGLMLTRGAALAAIASSLGPRHPRYRQLRQLASASGSHGLEAMFETGYLGSHWLGTFAIRYLLALEPSP